MVANWVSTYDFRRVLVLGVVILSVLDYHGNGDTGKFRFASGAFLFIAGFGAAFYATFHLGWRNAYGEAKGLKTDGWYRWSRNPIYVVSIVGMIGVALLANSFYVSCLLTLWAVTYLLAPFLEEPWLAREYGKEYLDYKTQVPRFIGIPRRETQASKSD